MTTAGPWSVKGIDPKAREIAKDLARRSGLTLGEWLNQMITDEAEEGAPEPEAAVERARPEAPPARTAWRDPAAVAPPAAASPAPVSAPAPAPAPVAAPALNAESFRSRLREAGRTGGADEIARVTKALAELTSKIEAAESRSTLAISGIDQQTLGVISRLESVERDQTSVAARLDGALEEVRAVQDRLSERMRTMEDEDGPRVEAMKALESALGKVAAQIYEGESRTRAQAAEMRDDFTSLARRVDRAEAATRAPADTSALDSAVEQLTARMDDAHGRTEAAVKALETSFAGLDQRLGRAESTDVEAGGRFERLAADLTEKVESTRTELASGLRDAADGKLDRMEAALRDLSGQVADSEKRSAGAIDRMGREVVRIAQGLNGRVGEVERQAREAAESMEGGMARIADAVEQRLSRADTAQAEALGKLGAEIERIAERLSDRIAASERRGAAELSRGLDEMGDRLGRASDKLNSRYDHAAADLAERIRASEERTARLLQEARGRMGAPAEAAAPPVEAAPLEPFASLAAFKADEEIDFDDPVEASQDVHPEAEPLEHAFEPGPFGRTSFEDDGDLFADDVDPFTRSVGRSAAEDVFDVEVHEPAPVAAPAPRPSSTRDLIEHARAAARANAEARNRRPSRTARADAPSELFSAPAPGFEEDEPAEPPLRKGIGLPVFGGRARRKESSTLKTALGASGVAAVLSLGATGAVLLAGGAGGAGRAPVTGEAPSAAPAQVAEAAASAPTLLAAAETPAGVVADGPSAAALVGPADEAGPLKSGAALVAPAAETPSARALYNQAVQGLERGDAGAVEVLRRAANLGYAPAQFHLGKVYEEGLSGARKDPAEARRWTERAARSGDAKAMFNLGIYLANGDGGARDDKAALEWFRRAADGGMKDAQYNLAVMNQNGRGAPASQAEAYKWFLIAAADGDAGARTSAEALKKSLAPEVQATAERSAAAYRAQIAATAAASQVRTASR